MIDENKIKEAAKSLRKDFDDDVTQGFLVEFGFEKGAKWAVNEFINELWDPIDEEPNLVGEEIIVEMFISSVLVVQILIEQKVYIQDTKLRLLL